MHELNRMVYMDAMGIDMFVPRVLLPHAKHAQQAVLPTEKERAEILRRDDLKRISTPLPATNDGGVVEKPVGGAMRSASDVVSALLEKTDRVETPANISHKPEATPPEPTTHMSSPQAQNSPATQPPVIEEKVELTQARVDKSVSTVPLHNATQGTIKEEKEKVQFSLSLWRVAEHIQIIDSRIIGEPLPTHALLSNIIKALGYVHTPLPNAEILNWPMVGGYDASWQAASQMVSGFLEGKFLHHPVQYIVLCGESALKVVLDAEHPLSERCFKQYTLNAFQCEVIVLPSLSDVLKDPHLKKFLWQALLPLKISP